MRAEEREGLRRIVGWLWNAVFEARLALLEQKYRPDQLRVPAGSAEGGRWADEGGGGGSNSVSTSVMGEEQGLLQEVVYKPAAPPGPVDLRREEIEGGHAIKDHVGQSDSNLVSTLSAEEYDGPYVRVYGYQEGSFNDLESAQRYVNDVLSSNPVAVADVATGRQPDDFLQKRYSSPTGREAFRRRGDPRGSIGVRPAFWVGVYIVHVGHGKGFSVRTAFPKNEERSY